MATTTTKKNLEDRLKANPDSLVFSRLADYYLNDDEIDRAVETCGRGMKLHPYNTTGRIVLGRCYMRQKRWQEAADAFAGVCRLDPRNSMAIKLLGDLLARQGSSVPAGDLYRLAASMDPFDAKMAAVASRAVGSGTTELLDILANAERVAAAATSAGAPGKPETIETPPDFSRKETLDKVKIAEARNPETERSGIPDGLEVSSRLDTLFGNETPASARAAVPRVVDVPGEELPGIKERGTPAEPDSKDGEIEELFIDSRESLPVEGDVDGTEQPPVSYPGRLDSDARRLSLDDSTGPSSGRRDEVPEGGMDDGLDRIDIVTPTLAEIYFNQGQLRRALAIYRRLLENDPGNDRLKRSIQAVDAAIASGREGLPAMEQERGKASRKIIEAPAEASGAVEFRDPAPAPEAKPKEKIKFRWIKRPDDRR